MSITGLNLAGLSPLSQPATGEAAQGRPQIAPDQAIVIFQRLLMMRMAQQQSAPAIGNNLLNSKVDPIKTLFMVPVEVLLNERANSGSSTPSPGLFGK